MLLLTIVNLTIGAYSPGFKALWLGFLSNGSLGDIYTDHDGISVVVDDIVFGILGAALVAVGHMGMNKAVEGVQFLQSRACQTACQDYFLLSTGSERLLQIG